MHMKLTSWRYDDLGLAFKFASLFGILPFKEGKFSKALWLRSVCLLIYLILTVFPFEIYEYVAKLPNRKDLVKVMVSTMYFAHKPVAVLSIAVHIYSFYKYRKMIEQVLMYLHNLKTSNNDRITLFVVLWILLADVNFMYFRSELKTWADLAKWARRISMFLIAYLNIFIISLYSGFLFYFENRLLAAKSVVRINGGLAVLEHAHVLRLCLILDSAFGPALLFLTVDSSYSVISSGYFITTLFYKSENVTYNKISEKVFFAGSLLYLICYPASKCEKVKNAAEAFNKELFKVMQNSKTLCCNDKLRLYVTMKASVDFTACGFFSLGYPLVMSIAAAATAYLVMLIDFSLVK